LLGALVSVLLLAGCGGAGGQKATGSAKGAGSATTTASGPSGNAHRAQPPAPGAPAVPVLPPVGRRPDARAVRVIKAWSGALRRGDVRGAAAYFRLPSELVNGVGTGTLEQLIRIRSRAEAVAANQTLPCGARFISAQRRGPYINGLFRLTGRPGPGGSNCRSGAGQTARTNFLIEDGKIVKWIRAPDEPGDNPTPPSSGPPPVV
jgi:hypothetical protein